MNAIPSPIRRVVINAPDGATLIIRQHGNVSGPRIVMSHGNGFAMNGYVSFWLPLLADFEVVLVDQRNHGENPTDGGRSHHLDGLAADLQSVIEALNRELGPKPTHGFFHSISSVAALWHAANFEWPWTRLVLVDPPIVPDVAHPLHRRAFDMEHFLAGWSIRRQADFASPSELAAQLRQAKGLGAWGGSAFDEMACAMLRAKAGTSEQSYTLCCPPALESMGYISNAYTPVWSSLERLQTRANDILVIGGDPSLEGAWYPSEIGAQLNERFGFRHIAVAGTSHLPQLEEPELVRRTLVDFLAS
ncbi:MAG: alpha/beta hydrolase [Gammaproteobacteria bacterium]|nr:alpha/beta hydrolase [Gammaproteobacteria bacterium]